MTDYKFQDERYLYRPDTQRKLSLWSKIKVTLYISLISIGILVGLATSILLLPVAITLVVAFIGFVIVKILIRNTK